MRLTDETGSPIDPSTTRDMLATTGIVFIEDGNMPALSKLLRTFSVPFRHPHEHSVGTTRITATSSDSMTPRPGRGAFSRNSLRLHTDRAMTAAPPTLLALLTVRAAAQGGESLLVDLAPALHHLARLPDLTEACRYAVLASADTHRPVLEALSPAGYMFRFRDDAVARPRLLSPCGEPILEEVRRLSHTPQIIKLGAGDGYIVHNHRYLHGRCSFTGDREVIRILANSDIPVTASRIEGAYGR